MNAWNALARTWLNDRGSHFSWSVSKSDLVIGLSNICLIAPTDDVLMIDSLILTFDCSALEVKNCQHVNDHHSHHSGRDEMSDCVMSAWERENECDECGGKTCLWLHQRLSVKESYLKLGQWGRIHIYFNNSEALPRFESTLYLVSLWKMIKSHPNSSTWLEFLIEILEPLTFPGLSSTENCTLRCFCVLFCA